MCVSPGNNKGLNKSSINQWRFQSRSKWLVGRVNPTGSVFLVLLHHLTKQVGIPPVLAKTALLSLLFLSGHTAVYYGALCRCWTDFLSDVKWTVSVFGLENWIWCRFPDSGCGPFKAKTFYFDLLLLGFQPQKTCDVKPAQLLFSTFSLIFNVLVFYFRNNPVGLR